MYSAAVHCPDGLPPLVSGVLLGTDGQGHFVFLAPIDEHRLMFITSERGDTPCAEYRGDRKPLTAEQLADFRGNARRISAGFSREVQGFIDPPCQSICVINAMDKVPHNHSSEALAQIIFIGDANHAMSPSVLRSQRCAHMSSATA